MNKAFHVYPNYQEVSSLHKTHPKLHIPNFLEKNGIKISLRAICVIGLKASKNHSDFHQTKSSPETDASVACHK